MRLKEFEGKYILCKNDLKVPRGVIVKSYDVDTMSLTPFRDGAVIKAQTLTGKRAVSGGIKFAEVEDDMREIAKYMLSNELNGEVVDEVLVEERIDIVKEIYISIFLDTKTRRPTLVVGETGGTNVEEIKKRDPDSISYFEINVLNGLTSEIKNKAFLKTKIDEIYKKEFENTVDRLYKLFWENDMKLLEINPLALTNSGLFVIDCKIDIDDSALPRLSLEFSKTIHCRKKTDREARVDSIDMEEPEGTVCKTFIDLSGDIGVIASEREISATAIDALILYGAKPANYTECSNNPPMEKVKKLAEIIMEKEDLSGLYIVDVTSNLDTQEILKIIIEVAAEKKVKYPIVLREENIEGEDIFEPIKRVANENGLDVHIYGPEIPITISAKHVVEFSENYKKGREGIA